LQGRRVRLSFREASNRILAVFLRRSFATIMIVWLKRFGYFIGALIALALIIVSFVYG
jgi:hypothetical protein